MIKFYRQDLDLCFGALNSSDPGFDVLNVWTWASTGRGHILPDRLLSVPNFRRTFGNYLQLLMDKYLSAQPDSLFMQRFHWLYELVRAPVDEDYWHHIDLGYGVADARNNPFHGIVHPNQAFPSLSRTSQGIYPWLLTRLSTAREQLLAGPQ
jgi:hypothetical protein